jgi:hypothetical protein
VSEYHVIREIFGTKKDEASEKFGSLNKNDFRNFYKSPWIVTIVKYWKQRWAGYVATKMEIILVGKLLGSEK